MRHSAPEPRVDLIAHIREQIHHQGEEAYVDTRLEYVVDQVIDDVFGWDL